MEMESFRIIENVKKIIPVFLLLSASCFSQGKIIKPFQLDIEYFTLFSGAKISLTREKIIIIDIMKNSDSIAFLRNVNYSDTLQKISEIDIRALNDYYSNFCVDDGISITIKYKRDEYLKTVLLENYYQKEIAKIIYYVNSLIPDKYRIWYDKKELISEYEKCNMRN
jgi:hypothetical protein